jgi:hypothetical protein
MLTPMETTLQIAEGASSKDPEVGLRAAAALRALAERLELLQVENARELGWSWQDIASVSVSPSKPFITERPPDREAMMFGRFTDDARGWSSSLSGRPPPRHGFIGGEHRLLATASTATPASAVLRDRGVSPERIETEILRTIGPGQTADLLGGLDREALASIGIDLDEVRTRLEAAFGRDALARAVPACRQNRRPAWRKGPVAELIRRRRRHRAAVAPLSVGRHAATPRSSHARRPAATFRSRRVPRRAWSTPCARPSR